MVAIFPPNSEGSPITQAASVRFLAYYILLIISAKFCNLPRIHVASIGSPMGLMRKAIAKAKLYMGNHYTRYQRDIAPLLDEEVDKLISLQERHHEYYQMTLFEHERKLQEQSRRIDELFDQFTNWVRETLTIQNNPYIRIVAVIMGVSQ